MKYVNKVDSLVDHHLYNLKDLSNEQHKGKDEQGHDEWKRDFLDNVSVDDFKHGPCIAQRQVQGQRAKRDEPL